jgi:crotonobetainyl-CoA:carnitine CoA-transferase CaiB-like acyl-CoA transferase
MGGLMSVTGQPDGAPVRYDRPPPALGAHTDEVLEELGLSPNEIGEMRRTGVL